MKIHAPCVIITLIGCLSAIPVEAQEPALDSAPPPPAPTALTRADAELPVDRIADLLALLPGVNSLNDGSLSVRGAGSAANDAYLDGVPIAPGLRRFRPVLLGGSWFGASGTGVSGGTNAFDSLMLSEGVEGAEFASARGGIIEMDSRRTPPEGGRHLSVSGGWATDAVFGTGHGLDLNRLTMTADGLAGRFSANIAVVAEGQGSERLGMDQNASPVYVANGIDTVVTVNNSGGGSTAVDVLKFAPSPGIRIPASATSNYSILGRAGYQLGERQRLEFTALGSQLQSRVFDYQSLYDSPNLGATRDWSRVVTGSWFGELTRRGGLALDAEAHLSWQTDRATDGPLEPESERSSRDPFGGFMLSPLDFRFDASSFPVNDQLVQDFRTNSGRLSPYDLSNTAQYQLVAQWRTNAYGVLTPFWESGGPVGRITLSQEDRVLGKIVLNGRVGGRQHIRLGAEVVNYDISYYSSQLTGQTLSDAYLESPHRAAVYGDYDLTLGQISLRAGLRYDHFTSGAERPYFFADTLGHLSWFPRISTMPGFNAASPTAPAVGCSTSQKPLPVSCVNQYAGLIEDPGHSRVSPRLAATATPNPRLSFRGAVTWTAQMPDFTAAYQGVNTDISVTNPNSQVYGTNVDFERTVLGEIGGRYLIDGRTAVDAAVWTRRDKGVLATRFITESDPQSQSQTAIQVYTNGPDQTASGLDLVAARSLGTRGRAWVSYSYVHTDVFSAPSSEARPHTLTAALLYQTGPESKLMGGLFRQVGVYADARVASGTPYTPCAGSLSSDAGSLSTTGACSLVFPSAGINSASLPALKLVDLRISKGIDIAGTTLTAFADVRNLLNTENVTQVFSQTGTTTNPLDHAINLTGDLQAYEAEASANGLLMADSTIDLRFAGMGASGCGTWVNQANTPATPNCLYLIRAEQRFGNSDHLFTVAEQTRASDAFYLVGKGLQYFTASGRLVRLGLQVGF